RYDPLHKGVAFRLGGVEREMSLLDFGWRVGLYSERESRDVATLSGLRNAETVNSTRLTHMFWPTIGDGGYNVRNTKAKSIRNPRIKLAHRCITMTITGRKETTNRVTEIDLFYLYCIFGEGVVCNIPYWLVETDITQKDEKQSQKRQNRARNGKDKVISKPKSVKVRKSTPTKSKVNQMKKI
ncbi:retrotransposon ORF1, partial [Tanacetum coccineum]